MEAFLRWAEPFFPRVGERALFQIDERLERRGAS